MNRIAGLFRMSDQAWRRHANPWSVYTRFAAIPAMILAIWSRTWIGWWALVPVAVGIVWLLVNPHVFAPVTPRSWVARGIYGEELWLRQGSRVPPRHRRALRWLIVPGVGGFIVLAWGLVVLALWPTVVGATLIVLAQLWRIDILGRMYEEVQQA
jgi:hypothetical protein